jgi:hypothetical protein
MVSFTCRSYAPVASQRAAMCWISVGVWKSSSSLSIAIRSRTGPRAVTQPARRPPPTTFDSEFTYSTWAGASSRSERTKCPSKFMSA